MLLTAVSTLLVLKVYPFLIDSSNFTDIMLLQFSNKIVPFHFPTGET